MRRTLIAAGVKLALGIPGVVPIFLAWYFLSNGPLSNLGWTSREPTENDGTFALGLFLAPAILISGALWGLVNWWLWRRTDVPAISHWMACLGAFFLPTLALAANGMT
jgi:hypothetical protein